VLQSFEIPLFTSVFTLVSLMAIYALFGGNRNKPSGSHFFFLFSLVRLARLCCASKFEMNYAALCNHPSYIDDW
jgi:hypothetical protein